MFFFFFLYLSSCEVTQGSKGQVSIRPSPGWVEWRFESWVLDDVQCGLYLSNFQKGGEEKVKVVIFFFFKVDGPIGGRSENE